MRNQLLISRFTNRLGLSTIYVLVIFVVLVALVSLGVEVGRVHLVRMQLQTAADSAARAGASGIALSQDVAVDRAVSFAAENFADGQSVALDEGQDIEFGLWDPGSRTLDSSVSFDEADAVRVTAYRTEDRDNATPLIFARLVGKDHANVSVQAIAKVSPGTKRYGIVGLDFINFHGNHAHTDSYNSDNGPYGGSNVLENGDIASNGNIDVQNGDVHGEAHPGVGQDITFSPNGFATDDTSDLDVPLNYPPAQLGDAATVNDNGLLVGAGSPYNQANKRFRLTGNGSFTLPAGTVGDPNIYYFTELDVGGNTTLTITGPVRIFVNGPITINGNMDNVSDKPAYLEIKSVSSSPITISGNGELFADIYAPQSPVTLNGGGTGPGQIFGAVIGKSITMNGQGADIHYDESLDGPPQGIIITLVK